MRNLFPLFGFAFVTLITRTESANILFYFGIASYSHKLTIWPLVEDLAAKGHKITFISPMKHKTENPRIEEIVPKTVTELVEQDEETILEHRINGTIQTDWENLPLYGFSICEAMLESPEIKKWLKTAKYDLVFIDGLFNECGLGLAYKFKAKTILFSTTSVSMWLMDMAGSVPESSWVPEMNYHYITPMTFLERVHNTLIPLQWHFWLRRLNYFSGLEELMRKELEIPTMPPLKELEMNFNLIFLTTHYSIEYARSLAPLYVSVAGMHIVESNNPLPKDIEKFIDESGPDGVIYVSFGSYMKPSTLPAEIKKVFYDVFARFKHLRFIWRFDVDRPDDLPSNIITAKWLPQQELLAHKKVKAFITHGGLGSIQEATYFGVPLIVFPLFAEQDFNANIIHQGGRGIKLEIVGIQKEELHSAIQKITTDTSYKNAMLQTSALYKDRPMKPLDTAIWWTEYILRNNDTSSLKPLSMHQTWYQRRLLDVWLFLLLTLLFGVSIVCSIACKCRSLSRSMGLSNSDVKLKGN